MKQDSMQWMNIGSPSPKKAKTQASARKLTITFWDTESIFSIEYIKKRSTINADIYKDTTEKSSLSKKRPYNFV